jgi:hypothetical protein
MVVREEDRICLRLGRLLEFGTMAIEPLLSHQVVLVDSIRIRCSGGSPELSTSHFSAVIQADNEHTSAHAMGNQPVVLCQPLSSTT